jgi:hypothetical protein
MVKIPHRGHKRGYRWDEEGFIAAQNLRTWHSMMLLLPPGVRESHFHTFLEL